jgi:plastocyanin
MRLKLSLLAVLAAGIATAPTIAATSTEPEIEGEDFAFAPTRTVVRRGALVVFKNRDRAPHNVTSFARRSGRRLFASRTVGFRGRTTFRAPAARGTYRFFCTVHPNMRGKLVVR